MQPHLLPGRPKSVSYTHLPRAQQRIALCDELVRRIFSLAGYAPQSAGLDADGRAESGTALNLRERKKCTDCVGLIKGYCWDGTEGNPKYASNGCPDISANGMYRAAKVKGGIKTLPETPGLLLWRDGHIGVYVGNGYAIEARGFAYGAVSYTHLDVYKRQATPGIFFRWCCRFPRP